MGLNALQLVNKVLVEKLGIGPDVTDVSSSSYPFSRVVLWALNEIQRELVEAYDWNFLKKKGSITLVADQDIYSLASDVNRITRLYYTIDDGIKPNVPKITLVGDAHFLEHQAVNVKATSTKSGSGRPYIARLFGVDASGNKQLQVYYKPSSSYAGTVIYYEYIREVPDLSQNTDTSPFPSHWLIEGAYMKLRERNGDLSPQVVQDYIADIVAGVRRKGGQRKRFIAYRDF